MRKVKYRLEDFLMFDYKTVERHLSKMAGKGWKLESTGPQFWKYRRIEPSELTFAVTYIPDASDFNPGPTESQMTLEDYCETAGWEKVCDWKTMQIFCTEKKNPVPIETDESVRLEVIRRSMERSFLLPNAFVLIFFIIMALFLVYFVVATDVNGAKVIDPLGLSGFLMSILGILFEIFIFVSYSVWVSRSEKAIEQGGTCVENKIYRPLSKVICGIVIIEILWQMSRYLQIEDVGRRTYQILYLPMLWVLIFLTGKVQKGLRNLGVSKAMNIVLTIAADFVMAFLLIGGMSYFLLR